MKRIMMKVAFVLDEIRATGLSEILFHFRPKHFHFRPKHFKTLSYTLFNLILV